MQTLNLARKEYGTIDYEIVNFPDGQKHLRILSEINHKDTAQVVCRITNGDDLFLLMQVADIFNRHCLIWHLDIKYLLAARTDRLFSMNEAHSLNIVLEQIRSLGANTISVFEMHNSLGYNDVIAYQQEIDNHGIYAFPDKGANKRYSETSLFKEAVICGKLRDEQSGKLLEFNIESAPDCNDNHIILLDDLCDGGGTFMGLEPKLRELNPKSLTLQVAHAIQLQGIEKVASVYNEVVITNSYDDWDRVKLPKNVTVIDVLN